MDLSVARAPLGLLMDAALLRHSRRRMVSLGRWLGGDSDTTEIPPRPRVGYRIRHMKTAPKRIVFGEYVLSLNQRGR